MPCRLLINLLLLCFLLFLGAFACQSPPENRLPEKPAVISGSIPSRPGAPILKTEKKSDVIAVTKKDSTRKNQEKVKPSADASKSVADTKPEVVDRASLIVEDAVYNSEGKIDPFASLISLEKEEGQSDKSGEDDRPPRILTPLEKLDYSQLRLVAVVEAEAGKIAMVEESGGKGYIVKIGTYIGKNSGKVVEIYNDRIMIREQVKNFKGKWVGRSQEMKLHKPDNEG